MLSHTVINKIILYHNILLIRNKIDILSKIKTGTIYIKLLNTAGENLEVTCTAKLPKQVSTYMIVLPILS